MSRTNIEIDDEAVARVMERYHLPTKRAAVDFALRTVAGPRLTVADVDALRGLWRDAETTPVPGSPVQTWPVDDREHEHTG
ncbi:type II toxin-antitoxin system VapB family antitoxin [Georgenia yuyongxinii]|uniref:Type II toxin-antitoxin system VapB family antitoxin n=1 Tax=Georgenia yuyongxinii TaxID=2589797 RepID=A0A552WVC0_9MICO|nr:type II toxin-antitoxin system VapB family antitoxin [Georgenia yuyongxinii]TRW46233.1 type II toxin-antitoxin system VapB family antitoxin [Georgenia yuyongxinii]